MSEPASPTSPKELPLLSISEGRIARTKKDQGIDFDMLNSCFALTAQFGDGAIVGAHFAHFGKDAGGYNPKELLTIFSKVLGAAQEQSNPLICVQIIGNLLLWDTQKLGVTDRSNCTLSEARAQEVLIQFLDVPLSKIKVIDTSFKTCIYLSIEADGSPVILSSREEDKSK